MDTYINRLLSIDRSLLESMTRSLQDGAVVHALVVHVGMLVYWYMFLLLAGMVFALARGRAAYLLVALVVMVFDVYLVFHVAQATPTACHKQVLAVVSLRLVALSASTWTILAGLFGPLLARTRAPPPRVDATPPARLRDAEYDEEIRHLKTMVIQLQLLNVQLMTLMAAAGAAPSAPLACSPAVTRSVAPQSKRGGGSE